MTKIHEKDLRQLLSFHLAPEIIETVIKNGVALQYVEPEEKTDETKSDQN